MLESTTVTYWLAGAHVVLGALAYLLFPRPRVTVLHYYALFATFAFGVRPALAASVGGYSNYQTDLSWGAYNEGLLMQLVFAVLLLGGYATLRQRQGWEPRPLAAVPRPRAFAVALLLGMGAIAVLQLVGGSAWMPSERTTTIDTAVPGGKYIFPIAVISLSASLPLGYLAATAERGISRVQLVIGAMTAMVFLSLLHVRGFVLVGVVLVLWAVERRGRLRVSFVAMAGVLFFMLGSVLRPVGSYVSRAITGAQPSEQLVAIEQAVEVLGPVNVARAALLYTTNNDIADSWPVVIDHVRDNGVLYGETFLGIPARFMPTRMRVNAGLLTAGDLLNIRYYGSAYAEKSFGFNVTLANELVLNFGPAGLVFGLVVGGLMAMADLWLTRVRAVSALAVLMAFALFGVGFTAEPAANVQWLAGMIVVGLLVEAGSRVSVRAPFGSGATLRSMPQTVHVR